MLGHGSSLWAVAQRSRGVPGIGLSGGAVAENASNGAAVGTLLVVGATTGTPSWSLSDDAGGKFAVNSSTGAITKAGSLDYETATSHSITAAVSGVTPSLGSRVLSIAVTNVLEVTLSALTLDPDEITTGDPEDTVVGALQSLSSGSTRSLTDTAGDRFKLSGTNIVAGPVATDFDIAASHNVTVRETHADASNSPRDTTIAITIADTGGGGGGDWILASGNWDDAGVWDDDAEWKDAA